MKSIRFTAQGKTKEYMAWCNMKQRCYNPKRADYERYGGKGIKICKRWFHSYKNFLADMGRAPSPTHSIDRINFRGHYKPSNCRWATPKQQANNKDKESARLKMLGNTNNHGFRHTAKYKRDLRKKMMGNTYLLGFKHSEASKQQTKLSMPTSRPVMNLISGTKYLSVKEAAKSVPIDGSWLLKALKKHGVYKGLTFEKWITI